MPSPMVHAVQLEPLQPRVRLACDAPLRLQPISLSQLESLCVAHLEQVRPPASDPDHAAWPAVSKVIRNRLQLASMGSKLARKPLPFLLPSGEMLRKWVRGPLYLRGMRACIAHLEARIGIATPDYHEEINRDSQASQARLLEECRAAHAVWAQLQQLQQERHGMAVEQMTGEQRRVVALLRQLQLIHPTSATAPHHRSDVSPTYSAAAATAAIPELYVVDSKRGDWVNCDDLPMALCLVALQRSIQHLEDSVQIVEELLLHCLADDRTMAGSLMPSEAVRELLEACALYWRTSHRLAVQYAAFERRLQESGRTLQQTVCLFEPPSDETEEPVSASAPVPDLHDTLSPRTPATSSGGSTPLAHSLPLRSCLKKHASFAVDIGAGLGDVDEAAPKSAGLFAAQPTMPYWMADVYAARSEERMERLVDVQAYVLFELMLRGLTYPGAGEASRSSALAPSDPPAPVVAVASASTSSTADAAITLPGPLMHHTREK